MRQFEIFRFWFGVTILCGAIGCKAQTTSVDGKEFTQYNAGHFKPHRGLFYNVFVSPVYTVDPLGFGGASTFGLGLGTRINLWESKTPSSKYTGLKIMGLYTALGFEYYPEQYNKMHLSLWLRIKALIPLAARGDIIYARGYGLQGINYRYCFGFEIKRVTVFLCGETGGPFFVDLGKSPKTVSPYANSGAIMLIIPILQRKDK